jgi:hypothetical protein
MSLRYLPEHAQAAELTLDLDPVGSEGAYENLTRIHRFEQADLMPHRNRGLAERRAAWVGK